MNFQNAIDKSTIWVLIVCQGQCKTLYGHHLAQSFMGAFKTGFIILFLQIAKLRHSFKNLPEYTQHIVGRTGIQSRSVWPRRVCRLLAEYALICSQSLTPFPAMRPCGWSALFHPERVRLVMWLSLASGTWGVPCLCSSFKDARVVWFCLFCAPFLCREKTRNKPCCVSPTNTAPPPWVPNKKTHVAKLTHRIDAQSPGSPLVMWARNECLYSRYGDF